MNRFSLIAFFIALGLLASRCGTPESSIQGPKPDLVLATAGDQTVTARDFLTAFQETHSFDSLYSDIQAMKSISNETPSALAKIFDEGVKIILFERDLAQKARAEKLDQKDEFKKYHENVVNDELYQRVVLRDVLEKIHVTEDDLKRFYEENRDGLYCKSDSNLIVVQGIYIEYGDKRPRDEAEKMARQAYDKITSGASFEAVAQEVSDASPHLRGKENSINLGQFDPEIAKRLESTKDGDITEAFDLAAKKRFYLFKRIKFIEPDYVPFEEVRSKILSLQVQERTSTGIFQLTQELRKKHSPIVNPAWLDNVEQNNPNAILLSIPSVYELTLSEFLQQARQQQKWTTLEQKEYLEFLGNKAICLAEAKSRGWSEKDVALAVDFWDNRKLAKDYVVYEMDKQVSLTEDKIREIYNQNPQSYQTMAQFDLSRLFFGIHTAPNIPSYQSQLLWAKAKTLATQAWNAIKTGTPYDQAAQQFASANDIFVTTVDVKNITLADLSVRDRKVLVPDPPKEGETAPPPMKEGDISPPLQTINLTKERYGYEIFFLRRFEPSRPMTYEEAREEIGKKVALEASKKIRSDRETDFFANHQIQFNEAGKQAVSEYLLKLAPRPDLQPDIARYEQSAP